MTQLSSTLNNFPNSDDMDTSGLINVELYKISEWFQINKLSLNAYNTRLILFHMPNKLITVPNLQVNNTNIEKVDEISWFNWKNHCNNTSS